MSEVSEWKVRRPTFNCHAAQLSLRDKKYGAPSALRTLFLRLRNSQIFRQVRSENSISFPFFPVDSPISIQRAR